MGGKTTVKSKEMKGRHGVEEEREDYDGEDHMGELVYNILYLDLGGYIGVHFMTTCLKYIYVHIVHVHTCLIYSIPILNIEPNEILAHVLKLCV